ncbi:MAG: hypothetical protein IT319_18800, partial [Anaerolineae bacterium]|nr:hypothetical protein [Anaerolineae bacterium]
SDTPTFTATFTLTPTDTATPTPSDTATFTATPSDTPTATFTPTETAIPSDTPMPTTAPTSTEEPTLTPTIVPTRGEPLVYANATSLQPAEIYDTLTLDNIVSGTIDDQHPAVLYAFNSTAGMVVHIGMLASDGDLDPFLLVLDPKGREIARNDDLDSTTRDATIVPLTLSEAGTYIIVATRYMQDYGETTGSFNIGISETDPQADPIGTFSQPISYESLLTGTLDDTTTEQTYTFRATAGDTITIQMTRTSGDLDSRLSLTNNLGSEIVGNDDSVLGVNFDAAIQSYIIPRSGYYTIAARRYSGGSNSGNYRLKLALDGRGASGMYAILDPANSTTINDGGDLYPNFSAGDEVDSNNQERTIQALLTFRLPPNDGRAIASATFSMQPCYETGDGFENLGALTVYQDNYGSLSASRTITRPLPGARVLSTQNSCASLDLTDLVQTAYANGAPSIQLRLIFRDRANNGASDYVSITPSLRLEFGE